MPSLLIRADTRLLFRRKHIRHSFFNIQLLADRFSSHLVVSGQHDNMKTHFPELPDCLTAGIPDGICHSNNAGGASFSCEKKRCLSLRCKFLHLVLHFFGVHSFSQRLLFLHKRQIPGYIALSLYLCTNSPAGCCFKILNFRNGQPISFCLLHHCLCKRMFAPCFHRCCLGQKFLFFHTLI